LSELSAPLELLAIWKAKTTSDKTERGRAEQMDTVFVAQRRGQGKEAALLLAEMGLHEGVNVAFDRAGRTVKFGMVAFDINTERELPFDSEQLTDAQRQAYLSYWAQVDQDAALKAESEYLFWLATRHPVRNGYERHGGKHLPKAKFFSVVELCGRLRNWLEEAVDEDVVGDIGTYAGRTWLEASVPNLQGDAPPVPLRIHADTKAWGIANFLCFVARCGGPENLRASRVEGRIVLSGRNGQPQFESGRWFYFSQT
jgi:hypothetical protein